MAKDLRDVWLEEAQRPLLACLCMDGTELHSRH